MNEELSKLSNETGVEEVITESEAAVDQEIIPVTEEVTLIENEDEAEEVESEQEDL